MNRIRLADLNDIIVIKKIIDESISLDYYSEEYIKEFIENHNSFIYVYVNDSNIPEGCLFCKTGELSEICRDDNIPYPDESFEGYYDNTKVMTYKTAATAKDCRKKGILYDFLEAAELDSKKIDHELKICLCCVIPGEIIPVKNHVEKNGFIAAKRFKSPWSNIKSYCSCCNNEYCQCDGMLYIKENVNEK